jgi:phosphatidate phosphatase APP1
LRGRTESYLFSQEMNHPPVACHPYKAGRHCNYCIPSFLALAFSSSIAFTIHYSMDDTTVHAPAAPVAPSANADDSGHDSGVESATMAASSPTRGATRMTKREITELTDFFKKTTAT